MIHNISYDFLPFLSYCLTDFTRVSSDTFYAWGRVWRQTDFNRKSCITCDRDMQCVEMQFNHCDVNDKLFVSTVQ